MMPNTTFFSEISRSVYDPQAFANQALEQAEARQTLLEGMLRHPHIMVYYHCFEALELVAVQAPDLLYPYWEQIVELLEHPNSYHRKFGLILLASLVSADREGRFSSVFPRYLERIHDEKFLTAYCCVEGLCKILACRPDLTGQVLDRLLTVETGRARPPKQAALFKSAVLELIEGVRPSLADTGAVDGFILAARHAVSPKTRMKAAELAARYGLLDSAAAQSSFKAPSL